LFGAESHWQFLTVRGIRALIIPSPARTWGRPIATEALHTTTRQRCIQADHALILLECIVVCAASKHRGIAVFDSQEEVGYS
jgi:hypothetical protein